MSAATGDGALEVVATLRAKPGREDDLVAIMSAALADTRAEEGCLRYDLYRVRREDGAFVMLERWASKQALRDHGASAHFQDVSARLADTLLAPPVVQVLAPIEPAQRSSVAGDRPSG